MLCFVPVMEFDAKNTLQSFVRNTVMLKEGRNALFCSQDTPFNVAWTTKQIEVNGIFQL